MGVRGGVISNARSHTPKPSPDTRVLALHTHTVRQRTPTGATLHTLAMYAVHTFLIDFLTTFHDYISSKISPYILVQRHTFFNGTLHFTEERQKRGRDGAGDFLPTPVSLSLSLCVCVCVCVCVCARAYYKGSSQGAQYLSFPRMLA